MQRESFRKNFQGSIPAIKHVRIDSIRYATDALLETAAISGSESRGQAGEDTAAGVTTMIRYA